MIFYTSHGLGDLVSTRMAHGTACANMSCHAGHVCGCIMMSFPMGVWAQHPVRLTGTLHIPACLRRPLWQYIIKTDFSLFQDEGYE